MLVRMQPLQTSPNPSIPSEDVPCEGVPSEGRTSPTAHGIVHAVASAAQATLGGVHRPLLPRDERDLDTAHLLAQFSDATDMLHAPGDKRRASSLEAPGHKQPRLGESPSPPHAEPTPSHMPSGAAAAAAAPHPALAAHAMCARSSIEFTVTPAQAAAAAAVAHAPTGKPATTPHVPRRTPFPSIDEATASKLIGWSLKPGHPREKRREVIASFFQCLVNMPFTACAEFRCEACGLQSLPDQLFNPLTTSFRALTCLSLKGNQLQIVPKKIYELPLQELDLSNNCLTTLDPSFFHSPMLRIVSVAHNRLRDFPILPYGLPNVRYLSIEGNRALQILGPGFSYPASMPYLIELYLGQTALVSLAPPGEPTDLSVRMHLQHLSLPTTMQPNPQEGNWGLPHTCKVTLPKDTHPSRLSAWSIHLNPDQVSIQSDENPHIRFPMLSQPDGITPPTADALYTHRTAWTLHAWSEATGDDVERRQRRKLAITQINVCIASLSSRLYLTGFGLGDIPDIFHDPRFGNLQELRLEGNALTALPPSVGRLPKLRELNCSRNIFTQLPIPGPGSRDFSRLVVGNFSENPLTSINASVLHLPLLEELDLLGTRFGPDTLTALCRHAQSLHNRPPLIIMHTPFPT